MGERLRWIRLSVVVVLMLLGAQDAWAECGTCQTCQVSTAITISRDYCRVANAEDGYTCCRQESYGLGTYCAFGGSACYGITVGGGGGGGTGGSGGGSCSYQNGWCPAECWSCSGNSY